ncbi:MAG: CHAT domain-containing protein [Vulcanimicrobiota bacterium]
MNLKAVLLALVLSAQAWAIPAEVDKWLRLSDRPAAERGLKAMLAAHPGPELEGWIELALYDLRPESPLALSLIERVERLWKGRRDSHWFAVRRRRLRCLFEQQHSELTDLTAELDQMLPHQPAGAERAGYLATRGRMAFVRDDRETGRKNLEAALAEPGLRPSQRLSYQLSLLSSLLNEDDLGPFEELWQEVVKQPTDDLDDSALFGLLQVELNYAQRKGVVWSSSASHRMRARLAQLHQDRARQFEALTSLVYVYRQGRSEHAQEVWKECQALLKRINRPEELLPCSLLLLGSAPTRSGAEWAWRNYHAQLARTQLSSSLKRAWALRSLRVSLGGSLPQEVLLGFSQELAQQAHLKGDLEMEIEARNWRAQLLMTQSLVDLETLAEEQQTCLQLRLQAPKSPSLAWGCDQATLSRTLAETYHRQQKSAAALEVLWQSLERSPPPERACQLLERIASISDARGANDQLERAIRVYPPLLAQLTPDQAAQHRAAMLEAAGPGLGERRQEWLSQLRQYYQLKLQSQADSVERFDTTANLVRVLKQLGDLAGARAVCEEALSQVQGRVDWRLDRVRYAYLELLRLLSDPPRLQAVSEQILADPRSPRWIRTQAYSQMIRMLFESKDYQKTLEWVERSESDQERLILGSDYKIEALLGLNRGEEALAILRSQLPQMEGPKRVRNLLRQGSLLLQLKRREEGVKTLREAFELSLRDNTTSIAGEAAPSLCISVMESGDEWRTTAVQALKHLKTGSLEPVSRISRTALILFVAQALQSLGRLDEAEAWLRENPLPSPPPEYAKAAVAQLRQSSRLAALLPAEGNQAEQEPVGALLDRLRLAYPQLGNLLTLRSSNLERLRDHLKPDQVLVAYYPTGEDLWLVGLSPQGAFSRQVALRPERLQELCRQVTAKDNLRSLYDLLIGPIQDRLGSSSQLLLVPTGSLWKVPFQALQDPQGRYLSQRWSASQLSSGDLLRLADGQWQGLPDGRRLLLGAPPEANLPGAEAELRQIAGLLPGSELRMGAQAESSALLSGEPVALLHLATHATFVPGAPLESGLMLHGDVLKLSQLHGLRLRPGALVVLSCCEGGMGNDSPGAEPVSLAGGLSAAGASTLIADLWKVDDQVAAILFSEFYRRLAQGASVHEAFRAGQEACRQIFPEPRDWGGFCLLGDPH